MGYAASGHRAGRKGRSEADGERAVAVEAHRAHERKRLIGVLCLLRA